MPKPIILVNGASVPPVGLKASGTMVLGSTPNLSLQSTAGVSSVLWTIASRPKGSTTAIASASPPPPFTTTMGPLDVAGTYIFNCIPNGTSDPAQVAVAAITVLTSTISLRIPALGEQAEWDPQYQWHDALADLINTFDAQQSGALLMSAFYDSGSMKYRDIIKASAGRFYSLVGTNHGGADGFLQVFNKATMPVDGDTPIFNFPVKAGFPFSIDLPRGRQFTNGIAYAVSSSNTTLATNSSALFWVNAEYI